jgi:hypothetical protein
VDGCEPDDRRDEEDVERAEQLIPWLHSTDLSRIQPSRAGLAVLAALYAPGIDGTGRFLSFLSAASRAKVMARRSSSSTI